MATVYLSPSDDSEYELGVLMFADASRADGSARSVALTGISAEEMWTS